MAVTSSANWTVINATPYVWQKSLNYSAGMVQWEASFPNEISPGDIISPIVSFADTNSDRKGNGSVLYTFTSLSGSELDFSFHAKSDGGPHVQVRFDSASSYGNPPGSDFDIPLDSQHAAGMPFILSGPNDTMEMESTSAPVDWMQQNLPAIGCQPLRRLAMPGSHDAGMSVLNGGTVFVTEENTLTQWTDIAGQLDAGFRYFDIRPVVHGGNFYTGHYSEVVGQWVGGNGQDIASIILQVNKFLSAHNELVILDLHNLQNTDEDWRNLSSEEFERLLTQLQDLEHLYSLPPGKTDLSSLPLHDFIGGTPAVIVLISDPSVALPSPAPRGFFGQEAMGIFNSFADTEDVEKMAADQISKMQRQRTDRDSKMFLLSWTLTTTIGNIRELALEAHDALFDTSDDGLWKTFIANKHSYPNIIYLDAIGYPAPSVIGGRNVVALAMAFNHMALQDVPCPL